ncbi:hypothetical protein EV359DRAFT_17187, partial [Lentinula novae-zelandiae]
FRHISEDMKQRAIWLLDHDLTIEQVGAILGVSESSIYHWKGNLEIHNSIIAPPSHTRGCPLKLNSEMIHSLVSLSQEAPEMYLDEIRDWL